MQPISDQILEQVNNIRDIRISLGLSQDAVAVNCGLTTQTINKWERAKFGYTKLSQLMEVMVYLGRQIKNNNQRAEFQDARVKISTVINNFKRHRDHHQLTQVALAKIVGSTGQTICRWEADGYLKTSLDDFIKILRYMEKMDNT